MAGVPLFERSGDPHEKGGNWETALAVVASKDIVSTRRIVELGLLGVYKDRLVSDFPVIQLGTCQLQTARLDDCGSVLDKEKGQAVRGDPIRLRHDQAIAVRIYKMRIDPACPRIGQLPNVQLARRQLAERRLLAPGVHRNQRLDHLGVDHRPAFCDGMNRRSFLRT
jgi:hypothetical protein